MIVYTFCVTWTSTATGRSPLSWHVVRLNSNPLQQQASAVLSPIAVEQHVLAAMSFKVTITPALMLISWTDRLPLPVLCIKSIDFQAQSATVTGMVLQCKFIRWQATNFQVLRFSNSSIA